jgi:hypothetical protein
LRLRLRVFLAPVLMALSSELVQPAKMTNKIVRINLANVLLLYLNFKIRRKIGYEYLDNFYRFHDP